MITTNDINGTLLTDVLPVCCYTGKPQDYQFPSCLATLVEFLTKPPRVHAAKRRLNQQNKLNSEFLTASGVGFAHAFDRQFLKKEPDFVTSGLQFYDAADQFLPFSMDYAGLAYEVIDKTTADKGIIWSRIKQSIDDSVPVLAQSSDNKTWCLITGYDEKKDAILGRLPKENVWPSDLLLDGQGSFYRTNWFDSLSRVLIITGKTAQNLSYTDFILYWITVMEKEPAGDVLFGLPAFDAMIDLLSDASYFRSIDEATLHRCYHYVHGCWTIAMGRAYITNAIRDCMEHLQGDLPQDFFDRFGDTFGKTHNMVYQLWSVIGNNGSEDPEDFSKVGVYQSRCAANWNCLTDVYAYKLRNTVIREKAAFYYQLFKENDSGGLQCLKDSLPGYVSSDKRIISVIGAGGQPQNPTYMRRAKGLVKNGRAHWMDEKTIQLEK